MKNIFVSFLHGNKLIIQWKKMKTKQWIARNQMEFFDGKQIFQQNSINFTNAKWEKIAGKKPTKNALIEKNFMPSWTQQSYMFVTKFTHLPLQLTAILTMKCAAQTLHDFEFYFLLNTYCKMNHNILASCCLLAAFMRRIFHNFQDSERVSVWSSVRKATSDK